MNRVAISILTWNSMQDINMLFKSISKEIDILKSKNFDVMVYLVDNGSFDGTINFLENQKYFSFDYIVKNKINLGISRSKNMMIKKSIEDEIDFFFMFDDDQYVIENSFIKMIEFMVNHDSVGCFAHNAIFYTKDLNDKRIPIKFPDLSDLSIQWNIKSGVGSTRAFCSYSLFREKIFKNGICFDESGPFGEAGYGFDDDDLGMQMKENDWDICVFNNIYVYHNISSSVPLLKKQNNFRYNDRKLYLQKKWGL